jgi:hypothetical protein
VNYFAENKKYKIVSIIAILTSFIYALILEMAQVHIPGRAYSNIDIAAGAAGAVSAAILLYYYRSTRINNKDSILLHICCAGCGAYVARSLKQGHNVTLFYYNPNIYPEKELKKRADEARRIAKEYKLPIVIPDQDHRDWLNKVQDHKDSPEGGERCAVCYKYRLERTAQEARQNKFDLFTTTMTISPHKNASTINGIGKQLEQEYGVQFLSRDFKKQDGFKNSVQLSKQLGLYRQNYCGCEFSRK